jgi:GNAT superfamily N-acetyltransferase
MSISLRRMTETDLAPIDELRRLAGWNQTPGDWSRLLGLQPEGCFVAVSGTEIVGTVTTTAYGQAVAWIGMMLVHPDHRRQGIATRLMKHALTYLAGLGIATTRLDATPAGFPLYQKLGFVLEWTLTRWQRPAGAPATSFGQRQLPTRELLEPDWQSVVEMDEAIFGAPRPRLIHRLAQEAGAARALAWPAEGPMAGWGFLRAGANANYLGPLVCHQSEGARALLQGLLRSAGNGSVIWDIPDQNQAATTAARELGFDPVRPLSRMRLGPNPIATAPPALFAIADPALG